VRIAVYHSNRDVRLEQLPKPEAGPGELVMGIEASGICGSDVMEWYRISKAPLVLGHEVAGPVVEVGEGVTRFKPGDRIVATHHVPCNTCRYCMTGKHSVCDTLRSTNFDPGGFAEYVRLPAINVDRGAYPIPTGVTYEEATFVEPLACVVRAQRIAGLESGQTVAVLGSGISGILQIQLARATGASRILATDVHPYRREMALRFGADAAIDAGDEVPQRILEVNEGRLADLVVVCTAALPAIAQSFRCVDRGGTILFFAPMAPGGTFPVPLHDVWKDGVSIVNSYSGPPADMRVALDLIAGNRVDVGTMVTHRLPLEQTGLGFRLTEEAGESMKVIIQPRRERL
jgi:L-iditol 2-dehydrogenase